MNAPMTWRPTSPDMSYPQLAEEVRKDLRIISKAFREAGMPDVLARSISTRALRTARRRTGAFQSNRKSRWKLDPQDPQFGSESDCHIIAVRLFGMLLQFENAPKIDPDKKALMETKYFQGESLKQGTYRDALLLEILDYKEFVAEANNPIHGRSKFHIGHLDPKLSPKHVPENSFWRTDRSNLIQGDMTIPQARIYILKLIARYFELGELKITAP